MQATCGEGHAAPAAGCQCGIHAWHPRPASARRVLASRFELPGIVEADGAVEVHADGFRAERARPYAFVRLPGRNPFLIGRIAASYGAEILDLRHPKELLAVCRERNLGLQEPVVEALLGKVTGSTRCTTNPALVDEIIGTPALARSRRSPWNLARLKRCGQCLLFPDRGAADRTDESGDAPSQALADHGRLDACSPPRSPSSPAPVNRGSTASQPQSRPVSSSR
jgi:hypothetical protein